MKKISIIILALVLMVTLFIPAYGLDNSQITESKSLENLSVDELIQELNTSVVKSDVTDYACEIATALNLKNGEIPEEEALSVILDESLDPIVRVTMIQLLEKSDRSLLNDTALKELLYDEETDNSIRRNIMWLLAKSDSNLGIIKSFAEGENGDLAFQAFKILSIYAPDEVVPLADKVITNYKNEDVDKVRGAIKFKAIQIGRGDKLISDSEVYDFLKTCLDLRDSYSNATFNDTVAFALSDMKKEESIKVLLKDEKISRENKAFCISENKEILLDMTKNSSQDEKDLLTKAMSIYPLAEVTEAAGLSSNSAAVITATGNQGYAVYRNGAGMNVDEHAGLAIASYTTNPCVIEMASTQQMRKSTWAQFMGGLSLDDYYGVYKPSGGVSSAGRDLTIAAANALYNADPNYVLFAQLGYPASLFGNPRLYAYQVVATRCDGVVEFSYEYNDYKVYGTNSYWNISIPSANSISMHTFPLPSTQRAAMTLVTTSRP